jgi:hypothetical protein
MRFKQSLLAATIVAVGFSAGMVPAVANEIGQVQVLVDYGYSTAPGENRGPIYVRDDVVAESLLETVRDGRMEVNSGAKCNTAGRFGICLMHNVKRCRHVELYASHAQRERSDRCLEGRWLKHPSHCGEA